MAFVEPLNSCVRYVYRKRPMPSIKPIVCMLLALGLLQACGKGKDFFWYEEAVQDDGCIVLVKKIESGHSASRKEPGANNYGYRLPKIELDDPKTGRHITWYPAGLPFLLPYALHVHDKVPYVFATFYLSGSYRSFGCPLPPYIVFRWQGDRWKRIALGELPRQFKRHNLLSTASGQVFNWGAWRFIKAGDKVDAEAIRQYVIKASRGDTTDSPSHLYEKEIQYTDIGPFAECNGSNRPTEYDNVELK